ncbi:MAG TPA: hypothetical protein VD907_03440 [Verrucomicrobiae bacterium]|nr:hypothetical protein [Verrucomicrobiae bacterium]
MDPQQQPTNNVQPNNSQAPQTPGEPSKNKKTMLIVVVIAAIVILGVIVFALMNQNKGTDTGNRDPRPTPTNNDNNNTPDTGKYQKYSVTDKPSGVAFSVSFYKDAKVEEKNGHTYLNHGEVGSMHSVYLGAASGDKIDCGDSPTTTMQLGGESTTVCYAEDNTRYAGYAKTTNGTVQLNLAGQKAISMEDAKAIMESVTFNQ